jgi:hypothetical protein
MTQMLLGAELDPGDPGLPPTLAQMHREHGVAPGKICGDCAHCYRKQLAHSYLKCGRSLITSGPGTDWRKSWPACGLFVEDNDA